MTGRIRTGLAAVLALVGLLVLAPSARAAAPAVSLLGVGPGGAGPGGGTPTTVLAEPTAPDHDGGDAGWRLNMDLVVRNDTGATLVIESVEVTYSGTGAPGSAFFNDSPSPHGALITDDFNGKDYGANELGPSSDVGSALIIIPDDRVHAYPLADSVTASVVFDGYTDPVEFTLDIDEYTSVASDGSYAYALAATNVPNGQYLASGTAHTYHSHHRISNNQQYAEDWSIVRWDNANSRYTPVVPSDPDGVADSLEDSLIWDKPLHAVADGTVVRCGNGFVDTPLGGADANPYIRDQLDDKYLPYSGNHIVVDVGGGEEVLYADFREGSLRTDLCPADDTLYEHDVTNGATVRAGEYLGRVGSSGNSSGPHLHIHSQRRDPGMWALGYPLLYHNVASFDAKRWTPNAGNQIEGGGPGTGDAAADALLLASAATEPYAYPDDQAAARHTDPGATDPSKGILLTPLARSNVVASTSSTPNPVDAGTTFTTTVTVANYGPEDATDPIVTIDLPAGFAPVSGPATCSQVTDGLACQLSTLAAPAVPASTWVPGTAVTTETSFDVTVSVAADQVYESSTDTFDLETSVTASGVHEEPEDPFVEEIEVLETADLSVTSVTLDAPSQVVIGESIDGTATVVVSSDGPASPVDASVEASDVGTGGASAAISGSPASVTALTTSDDQEVEFDFTVTCTTPGVQEVVVEAEISIVASGAATASDPDASNDIASSDPLEVNCIVPVALNIHPGSSRNPIQTDKVTIPAAVLTTEAGEYDLPIAFDATSIIVSSVRFGDHDLTYWQTDGAPARHKHGHVEDAYELDEATLDGDLDLVLHFRAKDTGLDSSSTEACIIGEFRSGPDVFTFFGCDVVDVVPN